VPKRTPACSRVLHGTQAYSGVRKRAGGTRAACACGRQGRGRRPPTAPPTTAGPPPGNGMASQTCPGVLLGVLEGGKLTRVLTVLPNTRPRVAAVRTSAPGPAGLRWAHPRLVAHIGTGTALGSPPTSRPHRQRDSGKVLTGVPTEVLSGYSRNEAVATGARCCNTFCCAVASHSRCRCGQSGGPVPVPMWATSRVGQCRCGCGKAGEGVSPCSPGADVRD
jgi:hypothetical protein